MKEKLPHNNMPGDTNHCRRLIKNSYPVLKWDINADEEIIAVKSGQKGVDEALGSECLSPAFNSFNQGGVSVLTESACREEGLYETRHL